MTALNKELRKKALARLAGSESKEAHAALLEVFIQATTALTQASQFDELASALDVLATIGYRFAEESVAAIVAFLNGAEERPLTYGEAYEGVADDEFFGEVYGAPALMVKALEALSMLRYLKTGAVLRVLLPLSSHHLDKIRKAALEQLEHTATYDISIFFGTQERPGIGAYPQQQILGYVEQLDIEKVKTCWSGTIALIEKLLSGEVRGTTWSYNQVVISQIAIPASDQVAEVRQRAIAWVIRIYAELDAVRQRSRLLGILNGAVRNPRGSDQSSGAMIAKDALTVVQFFESLVATEALQLVEKIEHYAYWIYFHSPSEDVRAVALQIKSAAEENHEFQIFKVLIGFEGIFGEWTRERNSDGNWDWKDKFRKGQAASFIEDIAPGTTSTWRERILRYSQLESDDLATFPVYIDFLERLAKVRGEFALELIKEHAEQMERFLVPLLRGLAAGGNRQNVTQIIDGWLPEARHLLQIAYSLDDPLIFTSELLSRVLEKSIEAENTRAIVACMSSAVSNFSVEDQLEPVRLFVAGIAALTKVGSSAWIFELWFRPKIKEFLNGLDETHVDSILANLMHLDEVDYHAEEILYIIAREHPGLVLEFFVDRLKASSEQASSKYQAVPFELQKVNEALAAHPVECVTTVRPLFDGDYGTFIYGGARLLKNIFPTFPPEFERELSSILQSGTSSDIKFVLAVLRNYDGANALAALCLEIVDRLSLDDPLLGEVAIVLESTGVVVGEFGFAEAMEKKKREALEWLSSSSEKIRNFAENYSASLERRIIDERARATEGIALRKAQYGEYD